MGGGRPVRQCLGCVQPLPSEDPYDVYTLPSEDPLL